MSGSNILQQVVKIKKMNRGQATHFLLCNGDKIRYLIALKDGKGRLSQNIAAYSYKLGFIIKMLDYLPLLALKAVRLGYFVKAELHPVVNKQFLDTGSEAWNMIVGTYGKKQKLVLQCFSGEKKMATFIKVGNIITEAEMNSEMIFLEGNHTYNSFIVPELLSSKRRDVNCPFNIQITNEFEGEKVEPVLTEEILQIYREIAGNVTVINGVEYEFSHGDFAPWNIKKRNSGYIVFDWEHCGMRIKGFDLMHYAVVIETILHRTDFTIAYNHAIAQIRSIVPDFEMSKELFQKEYEKLRIE